ncbi:MAG: lipocalin family protein [Prevotella sp.]
MKKTFYWCMLVVGMTTASCSNKPQQIHQEENPDTITVVSQNKTVFGLCGEGSAMNTLQLLTDSGDTLSLDLSTAKENNNIFGGYECGDKMAVLLTNDRSSAELVINETTLLGNWVMPNPLDGSSTVGISLKDGGIAESIDQSTIIYKTWKIVDGSLEIQGVREGGGDIEETNVYKIVKLDADSLIYKNEEDLFEYSRRK